jgi:hypothetical protein
MFNKEKRYDEHRYLTKISKSMIYTGIFFLSFGGLSSIDREPNAAVIILALVALVIGVRGIYLSVVATRYGPSPLSRSYWLSTFEDEYLNHLNMKGYKCAFMSINTLLLILIVFGEGGFAGTQQAAPVAGVAMFLLGILMLAYSLPIAHELRTEN